jgi:LysR family transcriptional regulator, salicylic acid-responsive activator of bsdBCD
VDLRQLHYFKVIIEEGSISKAATRLHMAQPPLSMMLKQMETYYGVPLIQRYRQKWEITEAGKEVYEFASKMLQHMDDFKLRMRYMAEGSAGKLKIGVASSCVQFIGQAMKRFGSMYPNVVIDIVKGDSEKIAKQLNDNEIDLAIILDGADYQQFEKLPLQSSDFGLVIPIKWKVNFEKNKLEHYPFISLDKMEGYSMLETIMGQLESNHISLNIVATCKDISIAEYLVANEVGISILPEQALKLTSAVTFIKLDQINVEINPVALYKKELTYSKLAQNFIQLLQ